MKRHLEDGYYLSVYADVEPIFHINNKGLRHDLNMTLFKKTGDDVELVHHWEYERVSGIKHHELSFYEDKDIWLWVNQLLSTYNLSLDDMQEVIGLPSLATCDDYHSMKEIPDIAYHAVSHLFTSMILDTDIFYNQNVVALALDGGPDYYIDKNSYKKNGFCGAVSIRGKVEFFPIPSPGPYWYTMHLEYGMPEGTLMALAYATTARFKGSLPVLPDIYRVIQVYENTRELKEFCHYVYTYPVEKIEDICEGYDNRFTERENKISMIMKFLQEATLERVNMLVKDILDKYQLEPKETYIAFAGGYALNCPTNTNIMHRFSFKGQVCCPALNDGGLAIGMGLYFFYKNCERFNYQFKTAYYGNSDYQLTEVLKQFAPYIKSVHEGIDLAADDILDKPVVWFDGRSEIGPRALGHRSILANPAKTESKKLLNIYKRREWWRPVAPIILEQEKDEWFIDAFDSPYMLNNFVIKEEKKELVESILHLDQTARVQTLIEKDNEKIYYIIKELYKKTGIPIVCNTSLNDKGEAIVDTIPQAFNFALRKGIHIVYINGTRVELHNHSSYKEEKPLERDHKYFTKHLGDTSLLEELNPYHLDFTEINIYKLNEVLQGFDLTSEKDVAAIRKIATKFKKKYDLYGNVLD